MDRFTDLWSVYAAYSVINLRTYLCNVKEVKQDEKKKSGLEMQTMNMFTNCCKDEESRRSEQYVWVKRRSADA